jgi:hypothetical protein
VRAIQSYVVPFYRRNAEVRAGLVEHVQSSRTASFQSLAELCELLSGRKPFPRRSTRLRAASPGAPDGARE